MRLGALLSSHGLACLACGLCYAGYSYMAWGWPAIDGYPAIERFLDPSYLRNDFYVNTNQGYGVDSNLALVFGGLERWTGAPYEIVFALLNLARFIALPFALYFLFRAATGSREAALWGVFLGAVSNFALPHTIAWSWLAGDPSPVMLTAPLVIAAWAFMLVRKVAPAALLLTLTCVFHPLMAVHGALAAAVIFLVDYTRTEKLAVLQRPANLAAGVLLAAATLVQYAALSPSGAERLPIDEYARILVHERHPGDFLISHFGRWRPVALILELLAAILLMRVMGAAAPRPKLMSALLLLAAFVAGASYIFVDAAPVRVAVALIPYRFIAGLAPFALLVFAAYAAHEAAGRRWLPVLVLAAAFLLASPHTPRLGIDPRLPLSGLLVLALAVTRAFFWNGEAAPLARALGSAFSEARLPAVMAAACLIAAAPIAFERRTAFQTPTAENQHPLYAWAMAHTRQDAVFLMDQFAADWTYYDAITPQKMRLIGRRAVVASLDFPFLDRDMRPWRQRWALALGEGAPDHINHADASQLADIAADFPFDYVVRNAALPDPEGYTLAARFNQWRGIDAVYVYARTPVRRPANGASVRS